MLQSFLREARIGHTRSSVLNPLQWVLVIVLVAFIVFVVIPRAPLWVIGVTGGAFLFVFLLTLAVYIYFMFKDPDALRSERYSLVKTAMDKRLVGDSMSGLRELVEFIDGEDRRLLPSGASGKIEHRNE